MQNCHSYTYDDARGIAMNAALMYTRVVHTLMPDIHILKRKGVIIQI